MMGAEAVKCQRTATQTAQRRLYVALEHLRVAVATGWNGLANEDFVEMLCSIKPGYGKGSQVAGCQTALTVAREAVR